MWRLKACPRCRGDLFPDYESGSWDMVCLQCGYRMCGVGRADRLRRLVHPTVLTMPAPDPERADTAKVRVSVAAGVGPNQE